MGKGRSAKPDDEKGEVQHERQEMGLIKKLEKMHPAKMLGKGQSTKKEPNFPQEGKKVDPAPPRSRSLVGRGGMGQPVIPGIQQPSGMPPKVDFGEPMMPPYTSGTPRSTRQGPYNMQGQGPPMGKGGRKPRISKSGPVVHPGKRGKMGA